MPGGASTAEPAQRRGGAYSKAGRAADAIKVSACAGEIRVPTLLLAGGQDPVIDPAAARDFFELLLGSADKTMHLYPKMLHEPLNELGRERVFGDVVRWLLPRL